MGDDDGQVRRRHIVRQAVWVANNLVELWPGSLGEGYPHLALRGQLGAWPHGVMGECRLPEQLGHGTLSSSLDPWHLPGRFKLGTLRWTVVGQGELYVPELQLRSCRT